MFDEREKEEKYSYLKKMLATLEHWRAHDGGRHVSLDFAQKKKRKTLDRLGVIFSRVQPWLVIFPFTRSGRRANANGKTAGIRTSETQELPL